MNDRSWMYNKNLPGRSGTTQEFFAGVKQFMDFALSHSSGSEIQCPCWKCENRKYLTPGKVREHLYKKGFTPNYNIWKCHGEPSVESDQSVSSRSDIPQTFPMRADYDHLNPQQRMIFDAAGPKFVPPWATNVTLNSDNLDGEDNSSFCDPHPASPNGQHGNNSDVDDEICYSKKFWDALKAADEPLWSGCETETQLSAVTELLRIKSEYNLSENCYNKICVWAGRCMPRDHTFPGNYYDTKKLVRELGLPMEKIDICPEGCMLYWNADVELQSCKFCTHARYKVNAGKKPVPHAQLRYLPLIPRLQRLFASSTTAEHMRWHKEHKTEDGMMCHPSDSETWKQFDLKHPEFSNEPRNVRLALCSDGFAPFGQSGKVYSCWPIIVTTYNLPPSMCLKTPYMFLTMVVPGPRNPKKLIDVCMQPLIEELNLLWREGVPTFDSSRSETFRMRAALIWTINDFPAYGMLSGWSTAGQMACPICMDDTKAFWLQNGKKHSWFDCHRRFLPHNHPYRKNPNAFFKNRVETDDAPRRLTGSEIWNRVKDMPTMMVDPVSKIDGYGKDHKWNKQSIFWQLPYWETLLVRHNLDVMHLEKNFFDNAFNTVMDVKGKTKDTINSRRDLPLCCIRPDLEVDGDNCSTIPKALYTLAKLQKIVVCNWIKSVKFPDGYASNIGRCVQIDECKLIGMKSHDCHIFMQRLLPIAFKEMLHESIWGPLTELSQFFQSLCSPTLAVAKMEELEKATPLLLCKLERIFPPSFFDSMEHLLIHLPYEAKNGGPVQYRWMYPFERFLHHLKKKVSNKARVEASICSSYITEEIATLSKHYFEPQLSSRRKRHQESDEGPSEDNTSQVSIFNYPGDVIGRSTSRWINEDPIEVHTIETYILLNCPEVDPYVKIFTDQSAGDKDKELDANFKTWFKAHVQNNAIQDDLLQSLAWGPKTKVNSCSGYKVNGYTFHTLKREEGKLATNSGVWVKGSSYNEEEVDYYGQLEEIITLEYTGLPSKKIVIFKCRWFDPNKGMRRVHKNYDLIEVNPKRLYRSADSFIFAQQASQVYYIKYPGAKRDRVDWWAVCKTKARSTIEPKWTELEDAYQLEESIGAPIIAEMTIENFGDPSGAHIDVHDDPMDDAEIEDSDDDGFGIDSDSDDEQLLMVDEEDND